MPFAGIPDKQVAALVLKGTRPERPPTPGNDSVPMSDNLWNTLQQCWSVNASERPKGNDLVDGLYFLVHGEKRPVIVQQEEDEVDHADLAEEVSEVAAPIHNEPERMSSRSSTPETVSSDAPSQLDTPLDGPAMGSIPRIDRSHSVEGYRRPTVQVLAVKPGGDTFPEDVPPPPYQAVDPARTEGKKPVAHSISSATDDEGSTTGLTSGVNLQLHDISVSKPIIEENSKKIPEFAQQSPIQVMVANNLQYDLPERPQANHVVNPEVSIKKSVDDEKRTTNEQAQVAKDPAMSTTHDEHGEDDTSISRLMTQVLIRNSCDVHSRCATSRRRQG